MDSSDDRTASLMTPAKLAQVRDKPRVQASPAAWLDQLAADAGHQHLRRLEELRVQLLGQAPQRDQAQLSAALGELAQALPALDFSLLQARGWWARTTGKSRSAGAEFGAQFDRADEAAKALAAQVQVLQKQQAAQGGATDRILMEFDVEARAIDKIIDQGARWLQDMRNQLKARMAQAQDVQSEQQVKDDAARCEILVVRLKLLRAAVTASQLAHRQAQGTMARRAALAQMLQQAMASDLKAWRVRLSALAAAAGDDKAPALNAEGPAETHRELQLCVKQAQADCAELQTQEGLLAAALEALGPPLAA